MAFNFNKFAAATGLMLNKTYSLFYGSLNGFPVYCKYVAGRTTSMTVRLHAATEDGADFGRYLESWRMKQTGIVSIGFQGHEMIAVLSIPAKNTVDTLASQVFMLVSLAQQSGLQPCCMACGRRDSWAPYMLDGEGCTLCESCRMSTEENMQHIAAEKTAQPVNPMGALLGIVIGAAVLFAMTFFVLKLGYVTYLTGYLGALVTLLLIKKFGGRLTYPTAIIGVIVCLLVAVATPAYEISSEIAKFNQENQKTAQDYVDAYKDLQNTLVSATSEEKEEIMGLMGGNSKTYQQRYVEYQALLANQTTWECFTHLTTLTDYSLYKDVNGELIKCILWGVLSIIIGVAVTLPAMLKESYGKHNFVRLA